MIPAPEIVRRSTEGQAVARKTSANTNKTRQINHRTDTEKEMENIPKIVVAVRRWIRITIFLNNCYIIAPNACKMMQKGDHPNIQYDRESITYMDREPSDNGINFVLPHVAELDAKKYITKQLFN